MWLFHLHSAVKNTAFLSGFPLNGIHYQGIFRLFLWNFKEKASAIFYNTAIRDPLLLETLEQEEPKQAKRIFTSNEILQYDLETAFTAHLPFRNG